VTFGGAGPIVIAGPTAGTGALHDTSVMLVDSTSGDQILVGETNDAGWGFYAIGIASYKLTNGNVSGDASNPYVLGSPTTAFMEYRITLDGNSIKIERGPTLANITQTGTATLGQSIKGRTFHVSIGATWAYYPATWDWIRLKALPGAGRLPHTGTTIQQCFQTGAGFLVSCSSPGANELSGPGKQDGMYANVNAMSYSAVPKLGGGSFANTECVKDNVTGLMWEGKDVSGDRAGANRYTNLGNGAASDASGYVAMVNATGLCGYTDWRLPTPDELQSLVDYGRANVMVDTAWFSNTASTFYWTDTVNVANSSLAWAVYFDVGYVFNDRVRGTPGAVRLVRSQ
jgi:hypothetical protein